MCLQETKISNKPFNPGLNYVFHRSPPVIGERPKGGCGFIVHKSVKHDFIQLNTALQACAIQIQLKRKITLCSLYLEPDLEHHLLDLSGNRRQLDLSDLQNLIDQLPPPFIIMGDFNAKHTLWGETICDRWGYLIEQLLDNNDIILLNDESPTRYDVYHNSTSAIDLSICSANIGLDFRWSVNNHLHGSDHWPIHLKYIHNVPTPSLPKWKIAEADWTSYEKSTQKDFDYDNFQSPIHAYKYLENLILDQANENIPRTLGLPHRPVVPWWNKQCAVARRVTRSCFRRYRRTPCTANKIAYSRAIAKQKKIIKESKRESWKKYISDISSKTPPSQIWEKIRKLQGKFAPSPLPILRTEDGHTPDPREVAELLGKHFANISSAAHYSNEFQHVRMNTIVLPPLSNNTESFNLPFTLREMENALTKSSLTSPGEDDIRYEMIMHLSIEAKELLLRTFNGIWKDHILPTSWHESIISPLHKQGKDPELVQSYRPIALTSCLCKLFERMANNRLVWYLETKDLLSNRQFGFRKNRSTLDPLLLLSRKIQNAFSNQNHVVGVFFDLEKAYDTTWRNGILKQLALWGIGGNMFHFIKNFLSDRYLKVRVGSELSSSFLQEEGVPQGSVLSVTCFAVAINSIIEEIPPGVQSSLFVDDFAVYCEGSTALEACRGIQTAINAASKWADKRGFKFSAQKTKAIRFSRSRKEEAIPTLFLKDDILPYEDEIKFLGVILDKKLTFGPHIRDLSARVKKSLNVLKVVSHFDWGADRKTLLRLYSALCLSKLDYACQIYSSACKTNLEKLDIAHNMGLRICTGAYRTSPVASIHVDSGLPPLAIRRDELSLRFLARSLTSQNNPNLKYVKNPIDRAVNKPSLPKPLEVRFKEDSRAVGLQTLKIAQAGHSKTPPWCSPPVKVCLTAGGKKTNPIEQIKSEFLKHASNHHKGIGIYTDGSKSTKGVGCAMVTGDVVISRKLPPTCSIFTAEIYAVLESMKYIFRIGKAGEHFTVYSDSSSSLSSLKQLLPAHHLVQEIQDWLVLLHSRKRINVSFCWVPAHAGVEGNERADKAAKEAINSQNHVNVSVPYSDFKETIRNHVDKKWQNLWSNLTNNLKLKEIHPSTKKWKSSNLLERRTSIILTRLRIGHTHLTHNYLLKTGEERQSPICNQCQTQLTVKHILVSCPKYLNERRTCSLEGRSLGDLINDDGPIEDVILFTKKIGLYHKF